MKKLLTIIILWFQIGFSQNDCTNDIPRQGSYQYLDILIQGKGINHFESNGKCDMTVKVISQNKTIIIIDPLNDYEQSFDIKGCFINDSDLVYQCWLPNTKKTCLFVFGANQYFYTFTVKYGNPPIVWRAKQYKNNN